MLSVLKITCNHIYLTIFIAVWTIVQSLIHVYGLMHIQWWRNCKINRDNQYYYLDFLFANQACDDNKTYVQTKENTTSQQQIEWKGWIINELDSVIFAYFILDAIWLVTAVGLLTGACCLIKGIWALVFYLPWITTSTIILVFDIFCIIFFGTNIPSFGTFFEWFSFIGITSQINALQYIEGNQIELVIGAVSIVMTFMAARAGIVWIANLVFLIIIVKLAIKQYKAKHATKQKRKNEKDTSAIRSNSQRIRDWHLFYDHTANVAGRNTFDASNYNCTNADADTTLEATNFALNRSPIANEVLLTVPTSRRSLSFAEKVAEDNISKSYTEDMLSNQSLCLDESRKPHRLKTVTCDNKNARFVCDGRL